MAEQLIKIILGMLLLVCGIQDLWKKQIYLWILGIGGLGIVVCLPFCEEASVAGCFGGLALGIGVMILSQATRGKIGMGDGILLCVTGLGLGFWTNLELFGIALFLAAMVSIVLLMLRQADRKKSIPFIPFLLVSYVLLYTVTKGAIL